MDTQTDDQSNSNNQEKELKNNTNALVGFILGIISAFLYSIIGILPILGLIFSILGLTSFDDSKHKNKWMAIWGLVLGIIYTLMYLRASIMGEMFFQFR